VAWHRAYSKDFKIIHTWRVREGEPIRGSGSEGEAPSGGTRGRAPGGGVSGAKPPEADEVS